MNLTNWLKLTLRLKRWIFLAMVGVACISYGLSFFIRQVYYSMQFAILALFLMVSGAILIYVSITYLMQRFYNLLSVGGFKISLDSERINRLMFEKRLLIRGPKIVAIGGGTGISTMLRGVKQYSSNITAVVTVADDGGGSGVLRQDLGMLPPGDIRNCILALADTEPIMQELLQYRFEDGRLKGQSFGNLLLAAMDGISNNFEEAVKKVSDVLAVTGKVLPVTLSDVKLIAKLENGQEVVGESNIGDRKCKMGERIRKVRLEPSNVEPLQEVLDEIRESDMIILGPGSLYTSVIPNLLVKGVVDAIRSSKAIKVYVCNIMTQPGETDDASVSQHVKAIEEHAYSGMIEYCFVNTTSISADLLQKYAIDGSSPVEIDMKKIRKMGFQVVQGDFVAIQNGLVRHDTAKLAREMIELLAEQIFAKDKKRALDYFYMVDRLNKLGKIDRNEKKQA